MNRSILGIFNKQNLFRMGEAKLDLVLLCLESLHVFITPAAIFFFSTVFTKI